MRRLHGWEPSTTTTYSYDAHGVVTETHTVREAEWDQWDHALMVALAEYRSVGICHGCGQPLDECLIPDDIPDDQLPQISAKRYEAGYTRCSGCYRLEYEQGVLSAMHKGMKEPPKTGHLHWYVRKL